MEMQTFENSVITKTYHLYQGFFVDVVNWKNEKYEIWLYHLDCAVKSFVLGVKTIDTSIIEWLSENIDGYVLDYIDEYMKDYIDEYMKDYELE